MQGACPPDGYSPNRIHMYQQQYQTSPQYIPERSNVAYALFAFPPVHDPSLSSLSGSSFDIYHGVASSSSGSQPPGMRTMHTSSSSSSNSNPLFSPSASFSSSSSAPLLGDPCYSDTSFDSDSGADDLADSVMTIRPGSDAPFQDDWNTAEGANEEPSTHEQTALPSTGQFELRITNMPNESRMEPRIKPFIELVERRPNPFPTNPSVNRWDHIQVPRTRSVKRKEFTPNRASVLKLSARITCDRDTSYGPTCCRKCQRRERKRGEKRTQPSHSASNAEILVSPSQYEASTSPLVPQVEKEPIPLLDFTCDEILDFSTRRTQLGFRITCYCSHHTETVGYRIQFILKDHMGRIIAEATSDPIKIIDNHKTNPKRRPNTEAPEVLSPNRHMLDTSDIFLSQGNGASRGEEHELRMPPPRRWGTHHTPSPMLNINHTAEESEVLSLSPTDGGLTQMVWKGDSVIPIPFEQVFMQFHTRPPPVQGIRAARVIPTNLASSGSAPTDLLPYPCISDIQPTAGLTKGGSVAFVPGRPVTTGGNGETECGVRILNDNLMTCIVPRSNTAGPVYVRLVDIPNIGSEQSLHRTQRAPHPIFKYLDDSATAPYY